MGDSWTEGEIFVGGVRLHYRRSGSGERPAVVLVHGFTDSSACWARVARDLEADYDIVMPDVRGHGLSERLRPGDSLDLAADLAGLVRSLELGPVVLVGHSMGAMISYETLVRFPELVRAAALEDPPWSLDATLHRHDDAEVARGAREENASSREALLARFRRDKPAWPEELMEALAESKTQLDPAIIDPLVEKLANARSAWEATAAAVTRPVLLVTGNSALGAIVTPSVVARIRALNPRWTIVNVPDVGHLIRYDNYDAYIGPLRTFLRGIPS